MNNRIIKCLCFLCLFVVVIIANAQVSDIENEAEEDKEAREEDNDPSNSHSTENEDDEAANAIGKIILEIFYFTFKNAQIASLEQKAEYPYVISLEGKLFAGYSPSYDAIILSPGLQGNWGMFATDFRHLTINDNTGDLRIIDWQVLKLNIPIKNFKGGWGIGFTRVLDPGISYFEYTISAEARLLKQKLVVSGEFRNTPDKEDDNFRQEFSIRGDYEVARYGKFHLSPMLGIMYQNYYKSFDYWFVHGGLFIRFH